MHDDFFILAGRDHRDTSLVHLKRHLSEVFIPKQRKYLVVFPEGGFLHKRKEASNSLAANLLLASFRLCRKPPSGKTTKYFLCFGMNTSERCLLRWTRLVSLWSLPARMKKSSCIQLTTPKLVNLNTLSMIHITLLQKPTLEEKMVMRSGTSAVDWWLGISNRFSCFSKSRSAPLSATSYPADQAQQETIEHSQEKKNSSICQNSSGWTRASGERRASHT